MCVTCVSVSDRADFFSKCLCGGGHNDHGKRFMPSCICVYLLRGVSKFHLNVTY